MKNRTTLIAANFILSLTMIASASASDLLGLYVGVSVGEAHVRSTDDASGFGGTTLRFDQGHAGWEAFAGIRPISLVGIEVGYTDFGRATAQFRNVCCVSFSFRDYAKQSATTVFALGYLPLPVPFLDIYGKAGAARLHTEQQVSYQAVTYCPARDYTCDNPTTLRQNQWGTNFAYGAGVQARMGSLAVRADYERIDASGGTPDLFSLGVTWVF